MNLDPHIPDGPIVEKWERYLFEMKLVNPANKRKFNVIVVGSGLAGASAAATMGELGYNVRCFSFHDSPRRAHSIAAQQELRVQKLGARSFQLPCDRYLAVGGAMRGEGAHRIQQSWDRSARHDDSVILTRFRDDKAAALSAK